jgi:RimJ/RimL family protein N-acetyltransferase
MILFLRKITKEEWFNQHEKLGLDKKWFIPFNYNVTTDFFMLCSTNVNTETILIGACTLTHFDNNIDCSIFIFPEHQRKGYATKCIAELIATYDNIQFTISMYNKNSIRFFESLNCLNKTEFRLQNRTFIFREFKKPTAKEIYH